MMLLFLAVFGVSCGFASGYLRDEVCYGHNYKLQPKYFPTRSNDQVYFTPSHGGPKKLLIDKGMPVDPRIRIDSNSFWLVSLTNRDEGTFGLSSDDNRLRNFLKLQILDCAETITMFYAESLERDVPADTMLLDYVPQHSLDEPITLWNRTDPLRSNRRRGSVTNNVWRISYLTQADNGFYNFRCHNNTVRSRILLKVKENTLQFERNESQSFIISYPQFGGPWTVTFQPEESDHYETLMNEGRLVNGFHRFTLRINGEKNSIEIENVELKDSGTFEFRDSQGNLALAVKLKVNPVSNHAIITYVALSCGLVAMGICCCCCCKKCCKEDSSTPKTEAAAPTVYDHDLPPTVPTYSGPVYPSAYPQQPGYQPVNIYPPPPVTNVNPSQPGYMNANPVPPAINVSPPPPGYMYANPIPPGINVSPPSPGVMNVNPIPPGINVSPPSTGVMNVNPLPSGITTNFLQTEVAPPADQGPTSTPTFSSEFLSSDSEPRFELTGFNIPSASTLMSNTPSSDVYNSDKLNFQ